MQSLWARCEPGGSLRPSAYGYAGFEAVIREASNSTTGTSEPLVDVYGDLCERLDVDPDERADRLTGLLGRCHNDIVDRAAFAELLGEPADLGGRYRR